MTSDLFILGRKLFHYCKVVFSFQLALCLYRLFTDGKLFKQLCGINMLIKPLVSIILAVNKDNEFLEKAIESILNQTYDNFELIIVANGCDESFIDKLQKISEMDMRIFIQNTRIRYLPFALNLGIHHSKGEYIARMDADDISHPARIERQVEYMLSNQNVGVVGSNVNFMDKNGHIFGCSNYKLDNYEIRQMAYNRSPFAHPAVMFKRALFERVGGYMLGAYSEDYDLWIRMIRDKEIIFSNIPESLLNYRIHGDQATSTSNARKIFAYDFSLKLRELLLDFDFRMFRGIFVTFAHYLYAKYVRK